MKTILDLHNIYYSYHTSHGETRALSNLSFSLAPGEFAAVVGPSGCGKSTLLSLICGLMKPQTGEILLNGQPVLGNSPQIGYMLQHDHLFEWRTIYRNILLGPEISHTLNKEIREKAKSMLTQYGLKSFIHARPSQLSGGMRQRAQSKYIQKYISHVFLPAAPYSCPKTCHALCFCNYRRYTSRSYDESSGSSQSNRKLTA